jgi:hypothetical protein
MLRCVVLVRAHPIGPDIKFIFEIFVSRALCVRTNYFKHNNLLQIVKSLVPDALRTYKASPSNAVKSFSVIFCTPNLSALANLLAPTSSPTTRYVVSLPTLV